MCGICGIHGGGESVEAIDAMLDAMRRRGPDGAGKWSSQNICLGHRRLAIVDLSDRGRQPMVAADGAIAATVNGEIYNYAELRAELEGEGCVFESTCDSETVIHAYKVWGRDSFRRYNGMFAFALWDAEKRKVFLVRDRLGIKPLYYWRDGARTFFASDVQAILAGSGCREWPISAEGLQQYLTYENRFGAETMFDGIRMLLPGHFIEIGDESFAEHSYVQIAPARPVIQDFNESVSELKRIFPQAVSRHLMADIPVASYLSAGLDSSLVTSVSAGLLGNSDPSTFTGTFREGGWYNEGDGAALVAKWHGLPNTRVEITAETFRRAFDDMVFALEEPRMGTGALPQYLVAEAVARTHKVILTGHGGDELFSGYPVFKYVLLSRLLRENLAGFFRTLSRVRLSEWPHIVYFTISGFFNRGEKQFLPRLFSRKEQRRVLKRGYALRRDAAPLHDGAFTPAAGSDIYRALLTEYFRDYLPGLLIVEDKISMAHGLESRTPFLDNELISFALSIEETVKLHDGTLKRIVREAAKGLLPDELFTMPKRGFPNPLSRWLRAELAPWMEERIAGPQSPLTMVFEPSFLQSTVQAYKNSWRRHLRPLDEINTHRIWMLLCLESWLRQYRDRLGIQLIAPDALTHEIAASA